MISYDAIGCAWVVSDGGDGGASSGGGGSGSGSGSDLTVLSSNWLNV